MLSVCDLNKLLSCDHIYHMNMMICHLNFYPLLLCNNVATVTSVRIKASHISGILGTQREKEYESATLVSFLAHVFLEVMLVRTSYAQQLVVGPLNLELHPPKGSS